jgi:hypothetical protein
MSSSALHEFASVASLSSMRSDSSEQRRDELFFPFLSHSNRDHRRTTQMEQQRDDRAAECVESARAEFHGLTTSSWPSWEAASASDGVARLLVSWIRLVALCTRARAVNSAAALRCTCGMLTGRSAVLP